MSLIEWKIVLFHKKKFCQMNIRSKSSDQKMPISDFQSQFSMSKIIRIFLNFFSLKNINLGAHFCYWHFLKTSIFKALYLLKSWQFFVSWIQSFGKRYENDLRVIFDQWPKLNLGFDVEPEIWILKVIYLLYMKFIILFT